MSDDRERIDDLRGHIDAAHAAADRLVREAQARAEAADAAFRERLQDVPQTGWAVGSEHAPPPEGPSELQLAYFPLIAHAEERGLTPGPRVREIYRADLTEVVLEIGGPS